ncbi:hypothetical protein [Limnovirga soli]|uniref:Protein BatD n=1 Tax=Limnovirga soli TaxID=2656915 RepID=A0A8J8JTE2_9BACT|nr:hypothetical protein [Limnovirga soli]NNV55070.1 hypothetical protein [Limnovirga soli]
MKKIFIIALIFFTRYNSLNAQLFRTQMTLSARPTALLSNWAQRPEILIYTINYEGPENFPVKIKANFSDGAGNLIGTSDLNFVPNSFFNVGTTILLSKDALLFQSIRFTGSIQRTLLQTGRLPAGSYQLTLQLLNATTLEPLNEGDTRPFTILSYQLPILMQPQNESILSAEQSAVAITFRWTPLAPAPTQERTSFQLQIFEIQEGQTPMQAFRSNRPLLDEQVNGVTQFIWRPQLYLADSAQNRKFIWTIQTLDSNGFGFNNGTGDGRSEPFWFQVKSTREILEQRKQ